MELDIIKCPNCGNLDLLGVFHRWEADEAGHPTIDVLECKSCGDATQANHEETNVVWSHDSFELVSENSIGFQLLDRLRDRQRTLNRQSKGDCTYLPDNGLPF